MNNNKIFKLSILFIVPIISWSQDTLHLNLEQCRKLAIDNSKIVKIADENIARAKGEKVAAISAWLPNVSATATGVYTNQRLERELYMPTQVFDPATGQLVPNVATDPANGQPIIGPDGNPVFNTYAYFPYDLTIQGGAMTGLSVQQPLYAGGKIIAGNKMARIGEDMAYANRVLKQAELAYVTDQAYYQYLSVKEKVKLAKEYQRLLSELAEVVKDSYETGMTNRNELLKIQVKYNNAVLQEQKAKTGLNLAQMELCRVIGIDLNTPLEINDSITKGQFPLDSLGNLMAVDRIEYQLLKKQAAMAGQNIKMVRGDYLPSVGVSLGYNYAILGIKGMDDYKQHGYNAIASIKIPITNFGEKTGKVKSAKAEYNVKKLELEQALEYLQLEIEQARLNYFDAQTQVAMTEFALGQAKENMRICNDNYALGMETIVNLLEAKAEWQKAYSLKIDALTSLKIQESNLLRMSNKLVN